MVKQINYKGNSVNISSPEEDVVIYSHPKDSINFEFDLSSLKKEIVKGDLVIHFLNGKKITIANYALMVATEDSPVIRDVLDRTYYLSDLVQNTRAVLSSDDLSPIVINRKRSSADVDIDSGVYLANAAKSENAEQDKEKFTGDIEVDERSTILSPDVYTDPYKVLSLRQEAVKKNNIDDTYLYTGKTYQSRDRDDVLPTPIIFTRLNIDAMYGVNVEKEARAGGIYVDLFNGGGSKLGSLGYSDIGGLPAVEYQYLREQVDFSNQEQKIFFTGSTNTTITRKVQIEARGTNVSITDLTLSGVPDGVKVVSTNQYTARSVGKGRYVLETKTQTPSVDVFLEYDTSFDPNTYKIDVSLNAYNYKYQTIVKSDEVMYWDFKPVNSLNDIENFNGVNVFTFSTNIDKLEITTSMFDDYIMAGYGDHIYNTLEGNSTFISGLGNDTVKMGNGDNLFVIGRGNNTVTVGNGINELDIEASSYISKVLGNAYEINGYVNVLLGNGNVTVNYKDKDNNDHTTEAAGFRYVFLGDNVQVVTINNTNNIGEVYLVANRMGSFSTKAEGSSKYNLYINNKADIYAEESYVTTNGGAGKAYFNIDRNGSYVKVFDKIYGSQGGGDNIYASSINSINYVGRSSSNNNTVHYEKVRSEITYNQLGSGEVVSGSSTSYYNGVNKIIGGIGNDIFYAGFGSASISMEYWGYNTELDSGTNTVTYSKSVNGVTIDYVSSSQYVQVTRGQAVDKLYYIQNVEASDKDDTFIMDLSASRVIDGRDGINTIDYQKNTSDGITINIAEVASTKGFNGTVVKTAGANDTFSNITKFYGVGGFVGTTFNINISEYTGGATYVGKSSSNNDAINYSAVKNNSVSINLTKGIASIMSNNVKVGEDTVTAINTYTLTDNNDTVVINDLSNIVKIGTINALNGDFEIGKRESQGNVFQIDSSKGLIKSDDLLNQLASKIFNFNSLVLTSQAENYFTYNYNIAQLFSHIYAGNKGDTFDISSYNLSLSMDIVQEGEFKSSAKVVTSAADIYLYDFTKFIGSSVTTTYNISANLAGSFSYGGGTGNTLDYGGIENNETSINLFIDLREEEVIKGSLTGNVDTFSGVSTIKGGSGDDTFYLDPSKIFSIDGGDGENTVSFKYYTTAIDQNLINQYSQNNFQIFELTANNNDVVARDYEDNHDLTIKGNGGINSYIITNSQGVVTFDVAESGIEVKRGGYVDKIFQFEKITGGSSGNTYNITASSNSDLSNSGLLYFLAPEDSTNNNVVYNINTAVEITIGGTDYTGVGSYIAVYKGKDGSKSSIDYFNNINKLTFSNKGEHIIKFGENISANWIDTEIEAGGSATISFEDSYSSNSIIIDGSTLTVNSVTYKISGWNKVVGGSQDDTFILKSINASYDMIDGGAAGLNTLDISESGLSEINMTLAAKESNQSMSFSGGNITYKNFNTFVFDAANKIVLNGYLEEASDTSQGYAFRAKGTHTNNGSTLDYSNVKFDSSRADNGFIFNITSNNTAEIVKDSINRKVDTIGSDFVDIYKGTSKNDTFIIAQGQRSIEIDGSGGRNSLQFNLIDKDSGVTYDLSGETASVLGANNETFLTFKNISVITGSSGDDTFKLGAAAENLLANQGNINAGGGSDNFLDMSSYSKSVSLNMGNLQISEENSRANYFYFSGINRVKLSDKGGNTLVMGDLSNGDLKEIDGGSEATNANMFSFETQNKAMELELGKVEMGSGSISIKNFSSYKLTNYNDIVKVTSDSINLRPANGYTIDGGGGINTIDYSTLTMAVNLTIGTDKGNNYTTAGINNINDTLLNFNTYKLSNADTTVKNKVLADSYTITGVAGKNNTIDYSEITNGASFTFDFGINGKDTNLLSVTKVSSEGGFGIDSLLNFNYIIALKGANVFVLNESYMASSTTVLELASDSTASLNAASSKVAVVYDESKSQMMLGSKVYEISGSLDSIIEVYGSATQKNTFNAVALYSTTYYGGNSGEDALNYTTTSDLIFDMLNETVNFGSKYSTFSNIATFKGGSGENTFKNLTDYTSYTIDGGNSVNKNTVSYDQAFFALTFEVGSDGNVNVTKRGGNVKDKLTNINSYVGSTLDDIFIIDLNVSNLDKYYFDGGAGSNSLVLKNAPTGGLKVIYNQSGTSSVNGTNINIANIQNFTLNESGNNTFTVTGDVFPDSLNVVAGGSDNKFILSTADSVTKNLVANIDLVKGTAILQTFASRIDLTSFDDITVNESYSATFNLFTVSDDSVFSLTGVSSVNLYDFNATKIDFNANDITLGEGVKLNNVTTVNLYTVRTSTTLDINVNSALNKNFTTNLLFNNNINLNSAALSGVNSINVNSVANLTSLTLGGSNSIAMKSFSASTLNINNSSNITLTFGSGSFDLFKTVNAQNLSTVNVDFTNYSGSMSNILIDGVQTTLTVNNNASTFNNILNFKFNNLEKTITIDNTKQTKEDLYIDGGANTTIVMNDSTNLSGGSNTQSAVTFGLDGIFNTGYQAIHYSNISIFDFSQIGGAEGGGNPVNYGITFNLGEGANSNVTGINFARQVAKEQLPHNVLNFSDRSITSANLIVNFAFSSGSVNSLMNVSGVYGMGSSSLAISAMTNVKHIIAPSTTSTIKFGAITYDNFLTLADNISHQTRAPDFNSNAILKIVGNANTTVDLSNWQLYRDDVWNWDTIKQGQGYNFVGSLTMSHGKEGDGFYFSKGDSYNRATPVLDITYETGNVILPQGILYFEQSDAKPFTLSVSVNKNPNSYLLFGLNQEIYNNSSAFNILQGLDGKSVFTLSGGKGDQVFYGLEAMAFRGNAKTSGVNIGSSGADGVFLSSKVKMVFGNIFSPDTNTSVSNHAPVNFSNIDGGNYYFTYETFGNPRHHINALAEYNTQGIIDSRMVSSEYAQQFNTYVANGAVQQVMLGGIGFTSYAEKDRIELGQREGNMSLMYGIEGVNKLTLTSATNTFSIGKFYNTTAGGATEWLAPFAVSYSRNKTSQLLNGTTDNLDGGTGYSTYLDQAVTADMKGKDNTTLSLLVVWDFKAGVNGSNTLQVLSSASLNSPDLYYAGKFDSTIRTIDGAYKRIGMKNFDALVVEDYNAIKSGLHTQKNKIDASGTVMEDFKDHVNDATSSGLSDSLAYFGKQDTIQVSHNGQYGSTFLVNLGGRYITDGATTAYSTDQAMGTASLYGGATTGNYYHLNVAQVNTGGANMNVSWVSDYSTYVDTSLYVQSGSSNYVIKNFDKLEFKDGGNVTLDFRTNINFDSLDGKMIEITGLTSMQFYYGYNYQVASYSANEWVRLAEMENGQFTGRYVQIWGAVGSIPSVKDATDIPNSTMSSIMFDYNQRDSGEWTYGNSNTEDTVVTKVGENEDNDNKDNSDKTRSLLNNDDIIQSANNEVTKVQSDGINFNYSNNHEDLNDTTLALNENDSLDSKINDNSNQNNNNENIVSLENFADATKPVDVTTLNYNNDETVNFEYTGNSNNSDEDNDKLGLDSNQNSDDQNDQNNNDSQSTDESSEGQNISDNENSTNVNNGDVNNGDNSSKGLFEGINFDELSTMNLDNMGIDLSSASFNNNNEDNGYENSMDLIDESSVVFTQKLSETDSMSFALDDNNMINDNNSDHAAVDANHKKHNNNNM